ncbi:YidC/Oxa1 family membrane protein insertase [Dactylosporangium sp. CA-092794]|uniref:YidC/Oxa1 family membrane protein insertase n=1 Tax=Dactylosporangium sp. CA-092794 TaxID=3239929 RepID=UPI003D8D2382
MVHHVLIVLAGLLGSVPLAIVVATLLLRGLLLPLSLRAYRGERVRARFAPRLAELRERYRDQPAVLAEQTSALLREEGAGPFAGLLPMLAQAPFVWLLYREFTGTGMHGHTLLGGDLTARLIGHPALLAGWLVVVALALIAVWNVRQLPAGSPWFARVLSFLTVGFAVFVPLAAGLYLVTTGVWTAAERWIFRRAMPNDPAPAPVPAKVPAPVPAAVPAVVPVAVAADKRRTVGADARRRKGGGRRRNIGRL